MSEPRTRIDSSPSPRSRRRGREPRKTRNSYRRKRRERRISGLIGSCRQGGATRERGRHPVSGEIFIEGRPPLFNFSAARQSKPSGSSASGWSATNRGQSGSVAPLKNGTDLGRVSINISPLTGFLPEIAEA